MVIEVAVVDDCRIELIGVLHDDLVSVVGDHGCGLVGLGVDVMVEIRDHGGELLPSLLVQVGDGNAGCEDGVVGVSDGHVCCRLGGLS